MKMLTYFLFFFLLLVADISATTLPRGAGAVKDAVLKQIYRWNLSLFEGNPEENRTNWNFITGTSKEFFYGSDLEVSISQELQKLIEKNRKLMVPGKTYFARYNVADKEPVLMTDDQTPSVVWEDGAKFEVKVDFFKYYLPILWPEAKWVEAFDESGVLMWATANGAPPSCWLSKLTNSFLYPSCSVLAFGGRFIVYDKDRKVLEDVTSGPELSIEPALLGTSATRTLKASSESGYGVKITIKSLPGRLLSLEWSPDLKNWQELTQLVADRTAIPGQAETFDSPLEPRGFYRVRVLSTAP